MPLHLSFSRDKGGGRRLAGGDWEGSDGRRVHMNDHRVTTDIYVHRLDVGEGQSSDCDRNRASWRR